jgi:hypothetical protein
MSSRFFATIRKHKLLLSVLVLAAPFATTVGERAARHRARRE